MNDLPSTNMRVAHPDCATIESLIALRVLNLEWRVGAECNSSQKAILPKNALRAKFGVLSLDHLTVAPSLQSRLPVYEKGKR